MASDHGGGQRQRRGHAAAQLYYPAGDGHDPATREPATREPDITEPDTTVIYTPHLETPGRPGPAGEHAAMAARLKQERKDFPGSFPGLDESLVKSLG